MDFFISQLPNNFWNFLFLFIISFLPLFSVFRSRKEAAFFGKMRRERGFAYTSFFIFFLIIAFLMSRFLIYFFTLMGLFFLVEFGGFTVLFGQSVLALTDFLIWTLLRRLAWFKKYSLVESFIVIYLLEIFVMVGVGIVVGYIRFLFL